MLRAFIAVSVLVTAAAAGAATTAASLKVAPTNVVAGRSVVVSGTAPGCTSGDAVTIISHAFSRAHSFAGVPAVFAKVKSAGSFRTSTKIPATRAAGNYGITARCGGGNLGVQAHLRVRAARATLAVTPTTVVRGYSVVVSGTAPGCPTGDTVTILSHGFSQAHSFAGVPVVFARVKVGGSFRTSTKIPAIKAPGSYGITARCGGGNLGVQARLRVKA